MPALSETQTPFFVRDQVNGLIPPQGEKESAKQYHIRLSQLYGLPRTDVEQLLDS